MIYFSKYLSPIGALYISEENSNITRITTDCIFNSPDCIEKETSLIYKTITQLEEYFSGKRMNFTVPISLSGTEFQKKVWSALLEIPYGKTCSYQDIAVKISNPKAVRAVGGANNKNPIMIIVPCHRVIGKNGKLTGYYGGLDKKDFLLKLEQRNQK